MNNERVCTLSWFSENSYEYLEASNYDDLEAVKELKQASVNKNNI